MSYRHWWSARWFLFEERFGPLIHASEKERQRVEQKLDADYARSVALLKARGSDGVR